jgi:hypothetical protein
MLLGVCFLRKWGQIITGNDARASFVFLYVEGVAVRLVGVGDGVGGAGDGGDEVAIWDVGITELAGRMQSAATDRFEAAVGGVVGVRCNQLRRWRGAAAYTRENCCNATPAPMRGNLRLRKLAVIEEMWR